MISQLTVILIVTLLNVKDSSSWTQCGLTQSKAKIQSELRLSTSSRFEFLSTIATSAAFLISNPGVSLAEEEEEVIETQKKIRTTIPSCPPLQAQQASANCVSTSNIKQIQSYLPPWTYDCTPDEAYARLKGVLTSDYNYKVIELDPESKYIKAESVRARGIVDQFEFLVKDEVVVFRSGEKDLLNSAGDSGAAAISDFGANKSRMESIRKKGAVFTSMGSGIDAGTAGKGGGSGPLGQLNAFFGFQSGQGFEDIVLE